MAVPARATRKASDREAGAARWGLSKDFALPLPVSLVMLDSLVALDSVFCVAW